MKGPLGHDYCGGSGGIGTGTYGMSVVMGGGERRGSVGGADVRVG